jgi:hypothetical protein
MFRIIILHGTAASYVQGMLGGSRRLVLLSTRARMLCWGARGAYPDGRVLRTCARSKKSIMDVLDHLRFHRPNTAVARDSGASVTLLHKA